MTGQLGHFLIYAPKDKVLMLVFCFEMLKINFYLQIEVKNYGVARYGMEVQRLCSVLNTHLQGRTYMVGEEYTIADIMIFPWFNIFLKPMPNGNMPCDTCCFRR